jgi:hypothetical protein
LLRESAQPLAGKAAMTVATWSRMEILPMRQFGALDVAKQPAGRTGGLE